MEKSNKIKWWLIPLILAGIILSNLYLQWCQNNLSIDLMLKFAFSWHTEKFLLGSLVLLVFYLFLSSLSGSLKVGGTLYSVSITLLGYATYLKMLYRQEPIYPDDLKMITQFNLIREMIGIGPFILALFAIICVLSLVLWQIYRSLKFPKRKQILRVSLLILSSLALVYISDFNNENNLLRRGYNRTALWIPYSQKMNYYNTGFIGGFLFNLRVDAMEKPENYSKEMIEKVVGKYQVNEQIQETETPNIIYIMNESFSNPQHLNGVEVQGEPLADYYEKAQQTYSGKMLSQNYGGGTANIEFEALTSFSMELFNPQMTTPYTMLVPKLDKIPSIVSLVENRGYQTTAIHPYDTSMYKRKDVYDVFGFDQFLDQDTMDYTETIENNPYISDAAAYQQILDIIDSGNQPQFVHLVTMQTHMPYGEKYEHLEYGVSGAVNQNTLKNYLQDIAYGSRALKDFLEALDQLPQRTLVVFWGDHLPGIYPEEIQAENTEVALRNTEFLMWDSQEDWAFEENQVTSPFYFTANLFERSQLALTPFHQLLLELEKELPAFEKGMYLEKEWSETLPDSTKLQELYQDYQLIQFDIVQGNQYSLASHFFE